MRPLYAVVAGCLAVIVGVAYVHAAGPQPPQPSATAAPVSAQQTLITRYCVTCHNQTLRTGGLALDAVDVTNVGRDGETWEKVVRKLRGGLMPPAGVPRPDHASYEDFVSWLETQLDVAAAAHPNPGRTETLHRLNRAEYRNVIRDLLGIDVDVASLLPPDGASYGFDNIAGVLQVSPTLMEQYLTAAKKISRAAVGTAPPAPNFDTFRMPDDLSQDDRLDGLPFGTRGGTRVRYNFPVDGEYRIRVRLARQVGGSDQNVPQFDVPQQLEVALDGERLQVFTLPATDRAILAAQVRSPQRRRPELGPAQPKPREEGASRPQAREDQTMLDASWQVRFFAKAGPRDVLVTFVNRTPALLETWTQPSRRPYPSGGAEALYWGSRKGAYLGRVEITGPFQAQGSGDTPSRRRVLTCRPAGPSEEPACAKAILATLTRRAYRRPVTDADLAGPLRFYEQGRAEAGFEAGIELAIRRLLVSPEFLFRTEADPANVAPNTDSRVSDLELASRLSFFLWSSIPDDELIELAVRRRLKDPEVLETQVRRMLADSRAQALVDNFVGQWLYLRNVPALSPDVYKNPDFDEGLRRAMKRETELFFEHIRHEDRSVLELLSANHTFVDESLAKHYGIPNVSGNHFRRVTLPEGSVRGGLLGQASILAVTAHQDRTSPVLRGKWILENILGTPPPEPPPNVPMLAEKKGGGPALSMRQRMAEHRDNPACSGCHSKMDPLGLALENFDETGRWRAVEAAFDSRISSYVPIDSAGALPDGTKFDGVRELRQVLMGRSDRFVATMTEKLLTYALGRGLEYYDMPAVRAITREAARGDHRLSALVLGVVKSFPFQMRRSRS